MKATQTSLELYDDFLAHAGMDRLQKILARYELFKLAMQVPGDVVECGVFKGSGIYTWAKLVRLFRSHSSLQIVGFDFFETSREMKFARQEDQQVQDMHAADWVARTDLMAQLASMGMDNVELIAGNVIDTAPQFAADHLGRRIALLYLDLDNYEGTLACLTHLFPLVCPGGVVAFDEYGRAGYGESDAVDEYFRGRNVRFQSFPWSNTPTAYLIKEGC